MIARHLSKMTLFLLLVLFPFSLFSESSSFLIDDFSKTKTIGDFPVGWKTYPFQSGKAKQVYQVNEEKRSRFIHAMDEQDISTPILKDFNWPLQNYPIFRWKWRALALPTGAKEDSRATNDSACGVYVPFGRSSGVVLKYVWSSSLPVGHVWEKEPGKIYVIVLASGKDSLNRWESEEVNVYEDYKKYFKKEPSKNPSGIGLMTDGNATHSKSACDYAGFTLANGS